MRLRLLGSFALIILIALGSMVYFTHQAQQEVRAYSIMVRNGMTSTTELVFQLESYYTAHGSWAGVEDLFDPKGMRRMMGQSNGQGMGGMMGGAAGNYRIRLADQTGSLVYDSSNATPQGKLTTSQKISAMQIAATDGQTVGYLLIEGDEQALITRLGDAARSAGLIAGGAALVLALLLAYQLVRPIRDLTNAATRMARGDLSQRVTVKGKDEIASLGSAFNQMAVSLETAQQSRRAMTADVAHELRTPLAVQRAQLEALQDGIYPLTAENLQPLIDQNAQLNRLVEDLRTLALAEGGELALECKPTDLMALLRNIVDRFRPQADAKDVRLELVSEPEQDYPPLQLDAGRIEQILGNLLANALRYTPAGNWIRVTIDRAPDDVVVEVRDSGPGIPEESLPLIFERFYRADRSRTRKDGGTGLGLAIARQLAEAHRGELTAKNAPDGGAVFTLRLPVGK